MKKTRFIIILLVVSMLTALAAGCAGKNSPPTPSAGTGDTGSVNTPSTGTNAPDEETEGPIIEEPSPFKYDGKRLTIGDRVSVHDPSIVFDETSGKYYVFGSHKAWAVSDNLASWKTIHIGSLENKTTYEKTFEKNIKWSSHGSANYSVDGNMWAPDVIYNKDMGKWCMYMSINGDRHYSSIVLLTSDKIDGKYDYAGTIVYSGFRNQTELAETDFEEVTGTTNISRYLSGSDWNASYGTNAIDPCVFYDKDGDLWMSYGSWFGGIFLLRLDNKTGLRDLTVTYETKANVSDAYMGYRISGGYGGTGEGSYIVWDEDAGYYYLYLSYCGLNATDDFSGYHIRLFRSENVTGPYVDAAGNEAVLPRAGESQILRGVKLFGNYAFSGNKGNGNASNGYMSGGHNSAFIDTDGQHYLVYHTRFNVGQEWHELRVHQQFMNEDGWPVTAVYEFLGSVIRRTGYQKSEICGEYEYVDQGVAADTKKTDMLKTKKVTLNKDGTITGDVKGTWEQRTGEDGKGYYVTMVINKVTYKGVFFKQYDETNRHKETMTFTLIGTNDHSIWGSQISSSK